MRATCFLFLLSMILLSTAALADVPGLINYQGTVTDEYGAALDTTVAMTFSIYTDSTAGIQVWTETQPAVTVGSGLFNVLLGSVSAIEDSVFKDAERWLGIQVGGDPELTPRQRMASVAYAMRAGSSMSDTYWLSGPSGIYYNGGDVGIGTSTPGQPLDVMGDVKVGGDSTAHDGGGEVVVFRGESGDWRVGVQNELTEEESDFFIGLTSSEDGTFHIERGGNVGIGTTSPTARLTVTNSTGTGISGSSTTGTGIYGYSDSAKAIYGYAIGGTAVEGYRFGRGEESATLGRLGLLSCGVWGTAFEGAEGYLGGYYGAYGCGNTCWGFLGGASYGAYGEHDNSGNYGYLGSSDYGVYGSTLTNYAGYFSGDVHITGDLTGGKTVIDHPLDPENKLLQHNFVESPKNLVIYTGKAALDASGEAIVHMPEYFEALVKEKEAIISLTPVGRPFLTGAEWNADYRSLTIYGQPGREVFWEVLADRDDPVVRQLARPVEEEKSPENKLCGRRQLLYPAAYGYPESMGRDYQDQMDRKRLDREELERQRKSIEEEEERNRRAGELKGTAK